MEEKKASVLIKFPAIDDWNDTPKERLRFSQRRVGRFQRPTVLR
jgi:hypothetical protein